MKKIIFLLVVAAFTVNFADAQTACSQYYILKEGVSYEYTNYNKKDKEDGKIIYKVTNVNEDGDSISATMKMTMIDKKGRTYDSEYTIICDAGVVKIDFKSLMNEQMLSQMGAGDIEIDVTGTDVELPNDLSVGQELPDANVNVKMKMGGALNMNMNVETVNRKVEKEESVTTPVDTYDCHVIYSETKTKMMMANRTFPTRMWYAKGIGMVKQESYDKNGKSMGTMVLTALNN